MTRYAIVEPLHAGHHLNYVAQLVRAAHQDGCQVVVFTTPDSAASDEFQNFIRDLAPSVVIDERVPSLRRAQQISGADVVVLPDGDHHMMPVLRQLLSLDRRTHVRLVLMRTDQLPGGTLKEQGKQVVKRVIARVIAAHPRITVHWLTDSFGVVTSRAGYRTIPAVADPPTVDLEAHASRPHDLPVSFEDDDRPWVVLTGVITDRKNPHLLLQAAQRAGWRVVLAGRIQCTAQNSPDAVQIDRHLSDAELLWLLQSADAVFVGYQNDAPSGILTAAALLGTPAIALTGTWAGTVVDELGAGRTCEPTPESVAEALQEVSAPSNASDPGLAQSLVRSGEFADVLLGRTSGLVREMVSS